MKAMRRYAILLLAFLILCKEEERKNHPPRIDRVRVSPEVIHSDDQIILNPVVSDPDGDKVKIDYHWYLNGAILAQAKSSTLDVEIRKGDRIEVELIPDDGKIKGKSFHCGPFVVENSPPRITDYNLTPLRLRTDTSLILTVQTEDVDGDRVEVNVDWKINGEVCEQLKNRYQLSPGVFKRGDVISCVITASDGEKSFQIESVEIEALNGPPRFIDFSIRYDSGSVYLKINAKDPDGDSVVLSVASGPEGISVDQELLQLSWAVSGDPGTSYTDTLTLKLSDSSGGSSEVKIPVTVRF